MAKREADAALDSGVDGTVTSLRPAAEAGHGTPHHTAADAHVTPVAPPKKKNGIVGKLVLVALLGVAGWYGGNAGYHWWTDGRFLITTDDAYVAADITTLAAKASGYITEVTVAENTVVKTGDVIARIDDGDYRIALTQAENALAGNVATIARIDRQIAAAEAQVAQANAGVASANASLESANINFTRQTSLVTSKVSAQSQLDDARTARDAAEAAVASAKAAVAVAEANIDVLKAQKVEAEATGKTLTTAVDKARRDLSFTEIRSPIDGVLGNKAFEVGTYVVPGQQLGSLVATGSAHVEANYKETQLAELKPGETVRITVDALGEEETILGTVESLSPATGSVFSLLPANNATGNFTKVVQRLPVRISVPADAALSGKLRPGLSVVVAADPRTAPAAAQTASKTASKTPAVAPAS